MVWSKIKEALSMDPKKLMGRDASPIADLFSDDLTPDAPLEGDIIVPTVYEVTDDDLQKLVRNEPIINPGKSNQQSVNWKPINLDIKDADQIIDATD